MTSLLQKSEFDDDQAAAAGACCDTSKRIVAVTGQAGTGKTTIMRDVYDTLIARGFTVALCAPTGKAAKRIKEATGVPASTIHRLLEYPHPGDVNPKTGKPEITTEPRRDRRKPLDFRVILADEYAMVSKEVHRNLLDALPNGGIIRMFGDANQLQPIEPSKRLQEQPSPFVRMLEKFDGHWLNVIHRQDEGSSIISNGARINKGQMPKRTEDFKLTITDTPVHIIEDVIMDGLNGSDSPDYTNLENQIISPTKQGWIGTESLNNKVQQLVQPADKEYVELERHTWSNFTEQRVVVGDKVIQMKNNYGLGVFNGESGIVKDIDASGQVLIDYGDKQILVPPIMAMEGRHGRYNLNPQKDVDLAYVITTHKSQGCEYDHVTYVMNRSRSFVLGRKNFYTGITRARKTVHVVTDQRAMSLSLYRDQK